MGSNPILAASDQQLARACVTLRARRPGSSFCPGLRCCGGARQAVLQAPRYGGLPSEPFAVVEVRVDDGLPSRPDLVEDVAQPLAADVPPPSRLSLRDE